MLRYRQYSLEVNSAAKENHQMLENVRAVHCEKRYFPQRFIAVAIGGGHGKRSDQHISKSESLTETIVLGSRSLIQSDHSSENAGGDEVAGAGGDCIACRPFEEEAGQLSMADRTFPRNGLVAPFRSSRSRARPVPPLVDQLHPARVAFSHLIFCATEQKVSGAVSSGSTNTST